MEARGAFGDDEGIAETEQDEDAAGRHAVASSSDRATAYSVD